MTQHVPVPEREYPCPCCGNFVFREPPNSYDICKICFWEDDISQLRFVTRGGASIPLVEAQKNYAAFGTIEKRFLRCVREPSPEDVRNPGWCPINPRIDNIEEPVPGWIRGTRIRSTLQSCTIGAPRTGERRRSPRASYETVPQESFGISTSY